MSSYASMPVDKLAEILGRDLAVAMHEAYRLYLQESSAAMYPKGTAIRQRAPRAEAARAEPDVSGNASLIPPLDWVESQLIAERKIIGRYQAERAAMKPVKDVDRLRTLDAVNRVKKLETIIRKHYSSATNVTTTGKF